MFIGKSEWFCSDEGKMAIGNFVSLLFTEFYYLLQMKLL